MTDREIYQYINFWNEVKKANTKRAEKAEEQIEELKDELRSKRRRRQKDIERHGYCTMIRARDEYATWKAVLPPYVQTKEDAEECFMDFYYKECRPSQYDCTGQIFTTWWTIGKQAGRYVVYFGEAMDV